MNPYSLTRTHKRNLAKLRPYLNNLPEDYRHFNMDRFFGRGAAGAELDYARKGGNLDQFGCGTIACALGHGPAAGVLFRPSEMGEDYPHWLSYEKRFVPAAASDFLFGFEWVDLDDHHYGAAARIGFILAGNEFPEDWRNLPPDEAKAIYRAYDQRAAA